MIVPLVEEAFFRGYLLRRLDGPGFRRLAALLVSSVLFALLHERMLAGLIAGLAFGLLMLHRGRLADAVAGHVVANATIALYALVQGDWSVI